MQQEGIARSRPSSHGKSPSSFYCGSGLAPGFPRAINRVLVVFLYPWSLWVRPQLTTQLGWWWEPRWAPYCGHEASDTQILTPAAYCCACVHAQLLPSWPALCDPMDSSPPGSSVHGILQGRILEWIAVPFSRGFSWPMDGTCISYISCIAGGFFTHWATWEAHLLLSSLYSTGVC